eukprot:98091-Chlamydomonas_euryale.AAC.1
MVMVMGADRRGAARGIADPWCSSRGRTVYFGNGSRQPAARLSLKYDGSTMAGCCIWLCSGRDGAAAAAAAPPLARSSASRALIWRRVSVSCLRTMRSAGRASVMATMSSRNAEMFVLVEARRQFVLVEARR